MRKSFSQVALEAQSFVQRQTLYSIALEGQLEDDAKKLWEMLIKGVGEEADEDIGALVNGPASDGDLHSLEGHFGIKLPAAFSATYKVHNGQKEDTTGGILASAMDMLSIADIIKWSKHYNDVSDEWPDIYGARRGEDERVKEDQQWRKKWVPFGIQTQDHKPLILFLDYDPSSKGKEGQVVRLNMRGNYTEVADPDFGTYFRDYAKRVA